MIKASNLPFVQMGDMNEKLYSADIINRYGAGLVRTGRVDDETHFTTFDWISNDTVVELKSRRILSNQYPTTMIGYNKVKELLEGAEYKEKRCFFLFAFTDGLFEWEVNEDNFKAAGGMQSVRSAVGFSNNQKKYTTFNPYKLNFYIPVSKLVRVCNKGCLVF